MSSKEVASGILQFLRVKEKQVEIKKSMKEMRRVSLAFRNWCISQGWNSNPVVFSYESVASFVCAHVVRNRGSTRSVGNLVAALKKGCLYSGNPWLGDLEQLKLMAVVSEMKLDDRSVSRRKRPIRLKELLAIINRLELGNVVELLVATMLALGHDGLLRSAELLSGLKVKHLTWRFDKLAIRLESERSKMNRSGESEFVNLFDYGKFSAVSLMRKWFDMNSLWDQYDRIIFPAVRYNRRHFVQMKLLVTTGGGRPSSGVVQR